jgi:hypothetical protein
VFFAVRCSAPSPLRTSQHHFHSLLIRLCCCLPGLSVTLCSITQQLPERNQCVRIFSSCVKCIEGEHSRETCPSECPIFETTDRISTKIGIWGCRAYADGVGSCLEWLNFSKFMPILMPHRGTVMLIRTVARICTLQAFGNRPGHSIHKSYFREAQRR